MKNILIKTKYIWLLFIFIGLVACEDDDMDDVVVEELPALSTNGLDFSKYVSMGASFTAGFTDGALFQAGQVNSFPNILAQQFGTANFTQPLTNDNIGGLLLQGNVIQGPRLYFNGAGPATLDAVPTTTVANLAGTFNNMGVPGAKSFHLIAPGYGNAQGVALGTANPYFARMASSGTTSVLNDAIEQNPTFFTLSEVGGNDVLGYAISGGDGSNPITPSAGTPGVGFDQTYGYIVSELTKNGAKGVVATVPYITDLPHFTTVPHNPVPLDANTAGAVNNAYAAYNKGLQDVLDGIKAGVIPAALAPNLDQAEVDRRQINFAAGEGNAVVIIDESLSDLTRINPALVSMRQATADDLLVLPASSFIGTLADPNNPLTVNGVAVPLADKWVLTPEEQSEIEEAVDAYNTTIRGVATSNPNLALVDLNAILTQASTTGVPFGDFNMTTQLVFGGLVSLDGIHLTSRGYALMAYKFLEAMDADFGTNFIAAGVVPSPDNYVTNYPPSLQ